MEFQSDQRREKESAATSGSSTFSGSSTSENLAPSPKRIIIKATPKAKQKQQLTKQQPTRKSNRARQSTLASALGNSIPINAVEDTLQTTTKKFAIDSSTDILSYKQS